MLDCGTGLERLYKVMGVGSKIIITTRQLDTKCIRIFFFFLEDYFSALANFMHILQLDMLLSTKILFKYNFFHEIIIFSTSKYDHFWIQYDYLNQIVRSYFF